MYSDFDTAFVRRVILARQCLVLMLACSIPIVCSLPMICRFAGNTFEKAPQ